MFKRWCLLASIIGVMVVSAPYLKADNGIGIQFGEPGNVGLSLRFDKLAIGASWDFGNDGYFHVTADQWLIKDDVAKKLDWFLGVGVDLGIGEPFTLAARLPIGLQWMPAKQWEIFGQVAPGLQLVDKTDFYIGGAVGVRYIF
jgi:hypothetical protein